MIENQEQNLNIQKLQKRNAFIPINVETLQNERCQIIPMHINNKIGFINHNAEIIVEPQFDEIKGEFLYQNSAVCVSQEKKWGVIDILGKFIISLSYSHIIPGIGCQLYSVGKNYKHAILDDEENIVVDYGTYHWIDGFDNGFARVKIGDKWGLININGELVLPIEYDELWNFYGKKRESTYARIGDKSSQVNFKKLRKNRLVEEYIEENENDYIYRSTTDSFASACDNAYYNECLDMDQQSPEFWDSL